MKIIITIEDDKLLQAINKAFENGGRPGDLDNPDYINAQDIAQWIVPQLELDDEDIEIERD